MEYRNLGRSGLKVSPLCLGTMNFGPQTPEDEAHTIMDAALDAGINYFDTSNNYGGTDHRGWTEEIIGRWFAGSPVRRDKVVLATKLYGDMGDWPNQGKLSALNIRKALDASLKRLQTDYIDIYQFHHVDRSTPWDEIWQAMEVATAQGKILYAGSSNFAGWHLAQAQEAASKRGFFGLISEQSKYSLLQRDIEREVLPAARHYGIGVIAWSPLAGGLLGGVLAKAAQAGRRASAEAVQQIEANRPALERWEHLAGELGVEPGVLALAWTGAQDGVIAPIIGPRTMDQLDSAIASLDLDLSAQTVAAIDQIFPGYRTSPEDYAW